MGVDYAGSGAGRLHLAGRRVRVTRLPALLQQLQRDLWLAGRGNDPAALVLCNRRRDSDRRGGQLRSGARSCREGVSCSTTRKPWEGGGLRRAWLVEGWSEGTLGRS